MMGISMLDHFMNEIGRISERFSIPGRQGGACSEMSLTATIHHADPVADGAILAAEGEGVPALFSIECRDGELMARFAESETMRAIECGKCKAGQSEYLVIPAAR